MHERMDPSSWCDAAHGVSWRTPGSSRPAPHQERQLWSPQRETHQCQAVHVTSFSFTNTFLVRTIV